MTLLLALAGPASAEPMRARLQDVLARREYTTASQAQDLLERLEGWLESALSSLLDGVGLPTSGAAWMADALLWLLLTLAVLALAGLVFVLARGVRTPPRPHPYQDEPVHEGLERPSRGWLDVAEEEAGRGDYRTALRYAYLALLRLLEERGVLRLDRDRTNWDLVEQVPEGPARDDLAEATRLFESRWYALRPADAEEYEALRRRVRP